MDIQKYFIFIGYSNVKHSRAVWDLKEEENIRYHIFISCTYHPFIQYFILFFYKWSMGAENGQIELSTGLETASFQDKGEQDSV